MDEIVGIKYEGTALPADSDTETLWDSTAAHFPDHFVSKAGLRWFRYSVSNSHAGTVKGYESANDGDDTTVTWEQFYDSGSLAAPAATATNSADVLVEGKKNVKFEWVNGGTTQTTFLVHLSLSART